MTLETEATLTTPDEAEPETYVAHPEKLMRIASVAKAMLDEARSTPCDPAGCERFKEIYHQTRLELAELLSDDLRGEFMHMTTTFDQPSPSPSELRVAQAELVGWLEGLFNGIAAAAMSQQMVARQQAEAITGNGEIDLADERPMPGQYL